MYIIPRPPPTLSHIHVQGHSELTHAHPTTKHTHKHSNTVLPTQIDWREKGAVLPAKNQMACGSCWAFSAVCALEGAHFMATGELTSLSEQQVLRSSHIVLLFC